MPYPVWEMSRDRNPLPFDAPTIYCIAVRGSLQPELASRFGGLSVVPVACESGGALTFLLGQLPDQAALLGVVNFLYNLRIPIWMVQRLSFEGIDVRTADEREPSESDSTPLLGNARE
jgi:hypothetical protein